LSKKVYFYTFWVFSYYSRDGPDPTRTYFWSAVNKTLTRLWPEYSSTRWHFSDPKGKKLKNFGSKSIPKPKMADPTRPEQQNLTRPRSKFFDPDPSLYYSKVAPNIDGIEFLYVSWHWKNLYKISPPLVTPFHACHGPDHSLDLIFGAIHRNLYEQRGFVTFYLQIQPSVTIYDRPLNVTRMSLWQNTQLWKHLDTFPHPPFYWSCWFVLMWINLSAIPVHFFQREKRSIEEGSENWKISLSPIISKWKWLVFLHENLFYTSRCWVYLLTFLLGWFWL